MSCPPTLHWRRAVSFFLVHSTGTIAVAYIDRGRTVHWRGELLGLHRDGPLVRIDGRPRVLCEWDAIRRVRPYAAVVVHGGPGIRGHGDVPVGSSEEDGR